MSTDRIARVIELLRREIGESIFRVITEEGFDFAAVTITHVVTARDLRRARVFVSVRATDEQRAGVLRLLGRHRADIQRAINQDMSLKFTPHLVFELDNSLEQGDHILDVLNHIATVEQGDGLEEYIQKDHPGKGQQNP